MFKWEGHSEVDKYALSVYEKHFPESEALGDITAIRNTKQLPEKLDLVTFGFPCQDLSVAGKRGGIGSSRSGLFTKAMRIIRAKRPSYIIFENVKGLYSSNEGKDFEYVLRTLARAGYDGQGQLLNTRWFLPQNRERIYFVGHLRGLPRPEIFPFGESSTGIDEAQGEAQREGQRIRSDNSQCAGSLRVGGGDTKDLIANTIQARCYKDGSENLIKRDTKIYTTPRGYNKGGEKAACGSITSNAFEHNNFIVRGGLQENAGVMINQSTSLTQAMGKGGGHIPIIQKENSSTGIRRLTPKECERLQGFPDEWTLQSTNGAISDSQRYKMMGNAVSVPVVKAVIMGLLANGIKIETYLDLFSGVGGFRLGIEEAINENILKKT